MTEAEERAMVKRLKGLTAMAKRRGCECYALHDDDAPDVGHGAGYDEDDVPVIVYWLYVPMPNGTGVYRDPVTFDDIDEVEADLNSRPVVKKAA